MPALALLICLLLVTSVCALEYARRTKMELIKQRDLLENRAAAHIEELQKSYNYKLSELQRLADFGRLSAHLLHDITNPLTAISLNLNQMRGQPLPAVAQARKSLRLLERYILSARKQLGAQGHETSFCVQQEIKQLILILKPLANKAGVTLVVCKNQPIQLYGDPVRFNQIMANLVANAIDAYSDILPSGKNRNVEIGIQDTGRYLHISVQDYGKGITAPELPQIFEPFYTTKNGEGRGLGIGLSIVKQYVQDDYKGTICAKSSQLYGTTFTVLLKTELPTLQY